MNLKECYELMHGDYDGVMSRLVKEERVKKFVLKFLDDTSYQLLCTSLQDHQYDEAFRATHTMKGICQNLGFTQLYCSSNELTEKLRNHDYNNLDDFVEKVKRDYDEVVFAIKKFQ